MLRKLHFIAPLLLVCFLLATCKDAPIQKEQFSEVSTLSFPSKLMNKAVDFNLYMPIKKAEEKLPVLYLLHGHGGNHHDWFDVEEGNVQHLLDSLITSELIPPVVAISMNAENSWYVDSDQLMEQAYLKEFMPYVEATYETKTDTSFRILAGNSMGGYGALNFGLKFPHLFKNVILLAPAAYHPKPPAMSSSRKIDVYKKNGAFNDSIWQSKLYTSVPLNKQSQEYPTFYTSTGDDDPYEIFDVVVDLKSYFESHQLRYEITVINGKHSWDVWRQCFAQDIVRAFNE